MLQLYLPRMLFKHGPDQLGMATDARRTLVARLTNALRLGYCQ
jgi:hypothetical protein